MIYCIIMYGYNHWRFSLTAYSAPRLLSMYKEWPNDLYSDVEGGGSICLHVLNVSLVNTYLFPWFVTSCSLTDLWEPSQLKVSIYSYNSLIPLNYSSNPNEGKSFTYKKKHFGLQTFSSPAIYTELQRHF